MLIKNLFSFVQEADEQAKATLEESDDSLQHDIEELEGDVPFVPEELGGIIDDDSLMSTEDDE